jgi:hypothetical protein
VADLATSNMTTVPTTMYLFYSLFLLLFVLFVMLFDINSTAGDVYTIRLYAKDQYGNIRPQYIDDSDFTVSLEPVNGSFFIIDYSHSIFIDVSYQANVTGDYNLTVSNPTLIYLNRLFFVRAP